MGRKLKQGSRIAVVGGGPAGSFFALWLKRFAEEVGLAVEVTIYEPKSFAEAGPRGCNRCAGILSARLLRNLAELHLDLPESVTQSRIDSYRLYSPFGVMEIHNPEPERGIVSVFRGGGPLQVPLGAPASFDNFLLQQAIVKGIEVVPRKVASILLKPYPSVKMEGETIGYDLVVLACGVNSSPVDYGEMDYSPPVTHLMAQDELYVGRDNVQGVLGSGVGVFLFPKTQLIFGTLVPKGEFISVSLLSKGATPPRMEDFLATDLVKKILSFPYQRACGCRPRIVVGRAKHFFGDGFVAIGDAAVTRLYKDGIGSAFLTAREAARTAAFRGISGEDFARYYLPYCRALSRDNFYGGVLFAFHDQVKNSPSFFAAHSKLAAAEWKFRGSERPFNRIIWGMFTGSYDYSYIFRTSFAPRNLFRLLGVTAEEKLKRTVPIHAGSTRK